MSSVQFIAGLTYPRLTVLFGLVYVVGRVIYGMGYRGSGPSGRSRGSGVFYIGLIGLLVSAIASALQLAGGVSGLLDFALSYAK